MKWQVIAAVVLAACGDRKEAAPPPPPPPTAAATLAAVAGGAPAAGAASVRVAVFDSDGLRIARITGDRLAVATHADLHVDSLAWLDAQTLVTSGSESDGVVVTRYVDDEPPRTLLLEDALFQTSGGSITSLVLAGDAVWVARCIDADQDPCKQEAFVRAWPEPHQRVTKLPAGAQRTRTAANMDADHTWPTAPAPAGAKLDIVKYVDKESYGPPRSLARVDCTLGAQTSSFPEAAKVEGDALAIRTARWVRTEPPIYEVVAREKYAKDTTALTWFLRACDPAPFAGFADLGDGLWAELRQRDGEDEGTWTFRRGERVVGEVPGGTAIRANR